MRDLMIAGEPAEWVGRQPPEFTGRPSTAEERTLNFPKYLTGFKWIAVAEDKGGMAHYYVLRHLQEGCDSDSHSLI